MTAMQTPTSGHPVAAGVARLRADVADLLDTPVWSMTQAETGATLVELTRLAAQVSALQLRVAGHASAVRVEDLDGATSTANWWAQHTRLTRTETHRIMRVAGALESHDAVGEALAAGDVLLDQAAIVMDAVDALPPDLDPGTAEQAETLLLDLAQAHDAKDLRRLGKGILAVVDPDAGDAHEAATLEREEREARQSARFTMVDDGHGKCHGRFTIPTTAGAMLKKALLAFAAPKHQAATHGGVARRPGPEKLGAAFVELIERYPTKKLPKAGGINATVVVTMTLDSLLGGLKAASLDTGETISAAEARRLACEAGIIPAVLGGRSEVLDLGRSRRFHNPAQRIAMTIRDQGCTTEGCDAPPALCHAHHNQPWSQGGHTTLADGRLACPPHHAMLHDPTYDVVHRPGGKIAFHRRE